jgi:two-component system, chemotaxis family, protein-glutamate methylesterase/glutaminase
MMQAGGKVFLEDPVDGPPRERMNAVRALGVAPASLVRGDQPTS